MEKIVIGNDVFFAQVRQELERGRQVTIPVKGYSMLPFIRGGKDLVVLEKEDGIPFADEIVLFYVGKEGEGRYVLHRVQSVEGDRVEIMGDGVPAAREHVTRDRILAKVVTVLRSGRHAVDPYTPRELRKVHCWKRLLPLRRYILWGYRHLPWNQKWLKMNK